MAEIAHSFSVRFTAVNFTVYPPTPFQLVSQLHTRALNIPQKLHIKCIAAQLKWPQVATPPR